MRIEENKLPSSKQKTSSKVVKLKAIFNHGEEKMSIRTPRRRL
jgi:hypothetical protein